MDIKTLEYKMRDRNGIDIAPNICLWAKNKREPITIQVLGPDKRYEFQSYQEAYEFTMPDGRKVKDMIDRLTDEDFKMVLQ